jgi:hypothetical protein
VFLLLQVFLLLLALLLLAFMLLPLSNAVVDVSSIVGLNVTGTHALTLVHAFASVSAVGDPAVAGVLAS